MNNCIKSNYIKLICENATNLTTTNAITITHRSQPLYPLSVCLLVCPRFFFASLAPHIMLIHSLFLFRRSIILYDCVFLLKNTH